MAMTSGGLSSMLQGEISLTQPLLPASPLPSSATNFSGQVLSRTLDMYAQQMVSLERKLELLNQWMVNQYMTSNALFSQLDALEAHIRRLEPVLPSQGEASVLSPEDDVSRDPRAMPSTILRTSSSDGLSVTTPPSVVPECSAESRPSSACSSPTIEQMTASESVVSQSPASSQRSDSSTTSQANGASSQETPKKRKRGRPSLVAPVCVACGATKSTTWRRGGSKFRFCNACGLKYMVRPKKAKASPTASNRALAFQWCVNDSKRDPLTIQHILNWE